MTSDLELRRVKAKTALEICAQFRLKEPASQLLTPEQTPGEFLSYLVEGSEWATAIRLIAYGLPKREAVWWCCLSLRMVAGEPIAPPELAALRAASHWCIHPSDAYRHASHDAGQALERGTPARLAAEAAFMSGGSLAPPGVRHLPPLPTMTARLVSSALLIAAGSRKPQEIHRCYRPLVALGIAIAQGKYGWTS